MCIMFVYTLLKVVGYYDLSVLSMSVMVSKKNVCQAPNTVTHGTGQKLPQWRGDCITGG